MIFTWLPSFGGRLGDLDSSCYLLVHCLDDTCSSCLSRTAEWSRGRYLEKLSAHIGLPGTISTRAASPGFQLLPRMAVKLVFELSKLTSSVSCVTVQHRCLAMADCPWVAKYNSLSREASCFLRWLPLLLTAMLPLLWWTSSTDKFLALKPTLSAEKSFTPSFTVHLNRLYFTYKVDGNTMLDLKAQISMGTVPAWPLVLWSFWRGRRKGLSVGCAGGGMQARPSSSVAPPAFLSSLVSFHLPNHGSCSTPACCHHPNQKLTRMLYQSWSQFS